MSELERRLAEIPEDAPLSEVGYVINEWEKWAIRRFRRMERTAKSDRIHPICPFTECMTNNATRDSNG